SWYHADDHPVNALFRRQNADLANDGQTYPQVGSPAWSAAWPVSTPDSNAMPQAWKDALNNAVAAGKIPNIPVSSGPANASPVYPAGNDPNTLPVCSATYKCRLPGDVWDAPAGTVGISFDDGPLPTSDPLYAFLKQNNVQATHFFIGVNIVSNWKEFNTALQNGDDIAVHTWTHPHMTSLSSLDVLAQLAWTMQIIHDSSGGRVPRFWRPPTGDTDARVSAIAKHVLGLTTIVWNQDTEDWSLGQPGGTTPQAIATNLQKWYTGPKSPGLIILEHELSNGSVQAFINAFPLIAQNGWKTMSLAEIDGLNAPYQNAVGSTGAV
ncbi:carbohydrate esterase family 4 protein, partial [Auriscalpium vulgare]